MWFDKQVSFYKCPADNIGQPTTFRQILMSRFAIEHEYYYKIYPEDKQVYPKGKWISGTVNDLETIIKLSDGELEKKQKVELKQTMQCFTPAALLKTKKQGAIEETSRTSIMQLDFDYEALKNYDVEEVKRALFDLPFVAFCGLSCSGAGFYALILIAEPEHLNKYAEHCFEVLLKYGIPADTTKGRNVQDLRFVSYDCNMLIRDEPKPLRITHYKSKIKPKEPAASAIKYDLEKINDAIIKKQLQAISTASIGNRWGTVQKAAYTLGGLGDQAILPEIMSVIKHTAAFSGEEDKYIECAEHCFTDGFSKPLQK